MFENIIGHKEEINYLINELNNDTVSHSYLFLGKSGIGKKLIAKEFAKQILKVNDLETCIDFNLIRKKDDKKQIVVEQVRDEILKDIYIKPISCEKKLYVIDEFENLNVASQNALLKILEEPPKHVCFIIIASTESSILATILSRVSKITFSSLSDDEIKLYVNKNNKIVTDNVIEFSEGSIGVINSIIGDGYIEIFENVERLTNTILASNYIESYKSISQINFNDEHIFDYLMYMLSKNNQYLCINIVQRYKNMLHNNGNYDIVVDNMLLKLIESINK